MNVRPLLIVLLAAAAVTASGCFGYPEGAIRPGDAARVTFTAVDLATGETIANAQSINIAAVGDGASVLGADVEQALVGLRANETVSLDSPASSRNTYSSTQTVEVPTTPPRSLVNSIDQPRLEQILGREVAPGESFDLGSGINGTILAIANGTVTYHVDLVDGYIVPYDDLGVQQVFHLAGENFTFSYEPMIGKEFHLEIDSSGSTPLGTPPGHYKTLGKEGDTITFAYAPDSPLHGKAIHVTITVLRVEPRAYEVTAPDGNYGVRRLPGELRGV